MYNDISVLEQMHAARTFTELELQRQNFLKNMSAEEWSTFRKMTISLILETDMSKHFTILGTWRTRSKLENFNIREDGDKLLVLQILLKMADIGHAAKE